MADEDGFIRRWSQRKLRAKRKALAEDNAERLDDRATTDPIVRASIEKLPDIDHMTAESDFSVFLRADVPDALRNAALRKLWRLDPAFGRLDGLLEYGEDYTRTGTVTQAVKTAYRIGRGFAGPEEDSPVAGPAPAQDAGSTPPCLETTPIGSESARTPVKAVEERDCGGNMETREPFPIQMADRSNRSGRKKKAEQNDAE